MAKATGSIRFTGLPDEFSIIEINDGQGLVGSRLKLGWIDDATSSTHQNNAFLSGTSASNNTLSGDAIDLIPVYRDSYNGSRTPFFQFGFGHKNSSVSTGTGGKLIGEWRDAFANDGTHPAKLVVRQPGFGAIAGFEVTFANVTSGYNLLSGVGANVSGSSISNFARRISPGVYEINTHNSSLNDLNDRLIGIFDQANAENRVSRTNSSRSGNLSLYIANNVDHGNDDAADHATFSFALECSGSTSWTSAPSGLYFGTFHASTTDTDGNYLAHVSSSNSVVYAPRSPYHVAGGSSANLYAAGAGSGVEIAKYIAQVINNAPIRITASASGDTVSLENDEDSSDGNITITTTSATNLTISGMSGGSGGAAGGVDVAKRLKISARQLALKAASGISGSADGKSNLMLSLDTLGAVTTVGQAHILGVQTGSNGRVSKITFSNLEDQIFDNVSGDISIAAGGAATIAAGAVEHGMLAEDIISGQAALGGATVAQADLLMLDDGPGTVKKVTFSNFEDSIFGNVSGDATIAAGGALTIANDAVESGMLNDNVISGQSALGSAAAAQADELLFSDGGTLKKITFSNLEDSIFGNLSSDLTVAAGGAVTMAAAQTNITSLLATDIKIGEDDQTKIDFEDADKINFYVNNVKDLVLEENVLAPGADSEVDLGKTGTRFKDAYVDSVTVTDDVTIGGNLTVNGTTTAIDTTHLLIEDSLIEIARGSGTGGSRASNQNAGMYISGSVRSRDVSLTVALDGGKLRVSGSKDVGSGFDIATSGSYAINGKNVLGPTALGAEVVASSLTSVGTLASGQISSGFGNVDIGSSTLDAGNSTLSSLKVSDLTSGRVVLAGTSGEIEDSGNLTFNGSQLTATGHMSASQNIYAALAITASFFSGDGSGLTGVGASVAEASAGGDAGANTLQLTFVSGAASAASFFMQSGSLSWRPSTDTLETVNISGSGTFDLAGAADIRGACSVAGLISGSGGMDIGGQVDLGAALNVQGATTLTGDITPNGASDTAIAISADSLYFRDADGTMHRDTVADIIDAVAGTVTATGLAGGSDGTMAIAIHSLDAEVIATGDKLAFADAGDNGLHSETVDDLFKIGPALVTEAAAVVADDYVLFLDGGASGEAKKESISDLVALQAGAGLQATNGVFSVKSRQDSFALTASIGLSGSGPLVMHETPASTGSVMVFFNGILQTQGTDYSLGGTGNKTISLKGANTLASSDEVVVKYIKS